MATLILNLGLLFVLACTFYSLIPLDYMALPTSRLSDYNKISIAPLVENNRLSAFYPVAFIGAISLLIHTHTLSDLLILTVFLLIH